MADILDRLRNSDPEAAAEISTLRDKLAKEREMHKGLREENTQLHWEIQQREGTRKGIQ